MVIRHWTYKVLLDKLDKFEDFERRFGVPMVLNQPGCQGVEFFRRINLSSETRAEAGNETEYVMISRWDNQANLQKALATPEWRDEIALFQAQHFNDRPGTLNHYELI